MLTKDYRPKVIIDYERIAYVEEITNVRITFDMKISASYELENFLDGNYQSFYVLPSRYKCTRSQIWWYFTIIYTKYCRIL